MRLSAAVVANFAALLARRAEARLLALYLLSDTAGAAGDAERWLREHNMHVAPSARDGSFCPHVDCGADLRAGIKQLAMGPGGVGSSSATSSGRCCVTGAALFH